MFPWLSEDKREAAHNRSIKQDVREGELSPLFDVPFADHTDRRPDPPRLGGRIPDEVRVNEITGAVTAVEKETHPNSRRSRRQNAALREGAAELGWDFEMEVVEEDECWPF